MSLRDELLRDAFDYAQLGLPVFPVRAKRPLKRPEAGLAHGFKDATTDPDVLQYWFQHVEGIDGLAIPTGRLTGTVALDIDRHKGGLDSLSVYLGRPLGKLPRTPAQLTGGGGYQAIFAYPTDGREVRSNVGTLGKGLDIRADGGYVVVPDSVHPSGNRYSWLQGRQLGELRLEPCPDWLLETLEADAERRANRAPVAPAWTGAPRDTAYGRAALESACKTIVTAADGTRERTLNDQAFGIGQLVAGGELSGATAKPALEAACEALISTWRGTPRRCDEQAAWRTLEDAYQEGQLEPRVAPKGGTS